MRHEDAVVQQPRHEPVQQVLDARVRDLRERDQDLGRADAAEHADEVHQDLLQVGRLRPVGPVGLHDAPEHRLRVLDVVVRAVVQVADRDGLEQLRAQLVEARVAEHAGVDVEELDADVVEQEVVLGLLLEVLRDLGHHVLEHEDAVLGQRLVAEVEVADHLFDEELEEVLEGAHQRRDPGQALVEGTVALDAAVQRLLVRLPRCCSARAP